MTGEFIVHTGRRGRYGCREEMDQLVGQQGIRVYYEVGEKYVRASPSEKSVRYYILIDVFSGEMLEVRPSRYMRGKVCRLRDLYNTYKSYTEEAGIQGLSPSAEDLLGSVEEMWRIYPWIREVNGDYIRDDENCIRFINAY